MDEAQGATVARPKIQWGEAAAAQSNQQEAEPAPVGDALSAAAATLEDERQKHEKRYALITHGGTIALRSARSVSNLVGSNARPADAMRLHAASTSWEHLLCRAARFNVEVKDVSRRPDLRQEARKQRALSRRREPEFKPGIDLFSEVHL